MPVVIIVIEPWACQAAREYHLGEETGEGGGGGSWQSCFHCWPCIPTHPQPAVAPGAGPGMARGSDPLGTEAPACREQSQTNGCPSSSPASDRNKQGVAPFMEDIE